MPFLVANALVAEAHTLLVQDPHSAYRFGQEVGRGQYGITSLVTENCSGTTYACKVISKHQRGFSLAYVRDEVLALQRVEDHLNIVSLHEVGGVKLARALAIVSSWDTGQSRLLL